MVLTEKDIKKLQDLNIKIEPGEIRSCDNPDEKGMEVCNIYKKKKLLTTLCNETDDLLFIENTVIPYLKKLTENMNNPDFTKTQLKILEND